MEELLRMMRDYERRIERLETYEQPVYVPLTDYGGTSTIVGWSSYTSLRIFYTKDGKRVWVSFFIEGTSNSTSTSFTLPYTNVTDGASYMTTFIQAYDNGVALTVPGLAQMNPGGTTVTCYTTTAGAAWTASGTKRVAGQFFYEAA